jgi:putative tryptophan/tyrosine transport system substrate-binding protein
MKTENQVPSIQDSALRTRHSALRWGIAMKQLFSILLIAVVLVAATAEAQQKKIPRLGYFTLSGGPSDRDEAFKQGLRELGWVDRQNIMIEYRWVAGKTDQLAAVADELARLKVDVIFATSAAVIQAAKTATNTIPIVMPAASDPVGSGFIASLARPGGNITGMSAMILELEGKRLELPREVAPRVARVAFLTYGTDLTTQRGVKEARDAGQRLGIRIQPLRIGDPKELDGAFSAMVKERAGAVAIQPLLITSIGQGRRIAELAAKNRLPTISDSKDFLDAGGLLSYGSDRLALWRRTAWYVDKILKGANPAELPVEQPKKFEFVINLKTAKQIGLTIPPNVLVRADKVIR